MKTIAYIIGFRSTDPINGQYYNLILTLRWLIEVKKILYLGDDIKLKILVVEQDTTPKFMIPKNIEAYIQYLFVYNSGPYNKGWGFNVGYTHFSADYYFFAECNIIMKLENIINVFKNCFKYEAVKPYLVTHDSTKEYILNDKFDPLVWADPTQFSERKDACFSEGIVGLSDHAIKSISGWDERFRGYGLEDFAFTAKINLFIYSIRTYFFPALHLWHQPETILISATNEELNNKYSQYDFYDYVDIIEKNCIGYSIKYSTLRPLEYKSNYKLSDSRYNFGKERYSRLKKICKTKNEIYLNLCENQNQNHTKNIDSNSSTYSRTNIIESDTYEM